MSGLDNLKTRLNYMGGGKQQGRMNEDKLRTLKKALIYSYQAATAIMPDGREFRCLMNRNKMTMDLDNKIISMPYKDICLNLDRVGTTTEGEVDTNIKVGDIITWKENDSHWIIYLQRIEETAYFRAEARRCRYQIEINGKKQWVYLRGPVEQNLMWSQASGVYFNKLNYTGLLMISNTEENREFFKRFKTFKINGKPWEVQAVDDISTEGIIEVAIKETFSNTVKDDIDKAVEESIDVFEVDDRNEIFIAGPDEIKPYDIITYSIQNYKGGGSWSVTDESRVGIVKATPAADTLSVTVEVITGRRNSFTLVYQSNDGVVKTSLPIKILSL
jgi:hypothetical protein